MVGEIWRDCKHYEDLYEVSNFGRVRTKKTGHYKIQNSNGKGYLFVELWANNKGKKEYVHRLVAMTFIDNPDNKPTVNHKDEDRQNNHVDNLEWMTYQENNNYGSHNERAKETRRKNGFNERQRKLWRSDENPAKKNPKYGSLNNNAKKVICDNKIFDTLKQCAAYYKVNYGTFRGYMCDAERMPKRFIDMGLRYA